MGIISSGIGPGSAERSARKQRRRSLEGNKRFAQVSHPFSLCARPLMRPPRARSPAKSGICAGFGFVPLPKPGLPRFGLRAGPWRSQAAGAAGP